MQGGSNVHLEMERFTHLQGITGMVQGMPHGAMALGTSKVEVPIGEFLEVHHRFLGHPNTLHPNLL